MKDFWAHFRVYVIRGLLAIIPLVLCYLTIKFIYFLTVKYVMKSINKYLGFTIPGLDFVFIICLLYFIGLITSNVLGRKFFNVIEVITTRIPIIKTAYQVGKQISATLSLPEQQIFKKAVLIDYFKPGAWTIGFVTGKLLDNETNEELLKVFIPTVPNPTSGFLVILKKSQTIDPDWTIDEAIKVVISGGIIGPETIKNLQKDKIC